MEDRIPTPGQEGRVLITPENGGAPFYATVEMADNPTQQGTPWSKGNVLKDATAALFGLGPDAVPDEVFSLLSRFNSNLAGEHMWEKSKLAFKPKIGSLVKTINFNRLTTYTVSFSAVVQDGVVILTDPIQVKGELQLFGAYYQDGDTVYYIEFKSSASSYYVNNAYAVLPSETATPGDFVSFVNSSQKEDHPENGEQQGFYYEYVGTVAQKPRMEISSYIGTGTYGIDHPTTLTFPFKNPDLIINLGEGNYTKQQDGKVDFFSNAPKLIVPYAYYLKLGGLSRIGMQYGSSNYDLYFTEMSEDHMTYYTTNNDASLQFNSSRENFFMFVKLGG